MEAVVFFSIFFLFSLFRGRCAGNRCVEALCIFSVSVLPTLFFILDTMCVRCSAILLCSHAPTFTPATRCQIVPNKLWHGGYFQCTENGSRTCGCWFSCAFPLYIDMHSFTALSLKTLEEKLVLCTGGRLQEDVIWKCKTKVHLGRS